MGQTGGWELITAEGRALWRKAMAKRHSQLSGLKQHMDFYCNGNHKPPEAKIKEVTRLSSLWTP